MTEGEYLDIVERVERAVMGDKTVVERLVQMDLPKLLGFVRDLQRRLPEEEQW